MFSTLVWVGFSQSLFAAILISAKKQSQVQDKILSAWLFLLSFEFLTCAVDLLIWKTPLLSSSFLLFNPAFYLYVQSLTDSKFKLKKIQLLHLLPFLSFQIGAYMLKQKYTLHNFFEFDSTQWFRFAFSIASIISWLIYNYLSSVMVYKHRKKLENEFSTISKDESLQWLLFIIIFYNIFCAFSLVIAVFAISLPHTGITQYIYNYSALLVLIYVLGFYGLRQKKIFLNGDENSSTKSKYQNSALSQKRKDQINKTIIQYIESTQAYLNPDLNMNLLSKNIDIPKHQITEVLSTELGKNFFNLINEYRVNAVKKLLLDKSINYSIEGIGYDCGFNSKSSFFTVFKKFTGMTPTEYKESQ
ncbi:MAG: helix-turn-helix domain-containing protein [Bacteroidales bacterium]|nr:helix-turn-helix domain-containing protein [Bacteroidales bacterium]